MLEMICSAYTKQITHRHCLRGGVFCYQCDVGVTLRHEYIEISIKNVDFLNHRWWFDSARGYQNKNALKTLIFKRFRAFIFYIFDYIFF